MTARIVHGNCIKVMDAIDAEFDFVFADPPFNIGYEYSGYADKRDPGEYLQFTVDYTRRMVQKAGDKGIISLHGPDSLYDIWRDTRRETGLADMRRIAWINWWWDFGRCTRKSWIDSRCHCQVFTKTEHHTWNPDDVTIESARSSVYSDKRIKETKNGGRRLPGTVWGVPSDGPYFGRLVGHNMEKQFNKKDRNGRSIHKNQLPEVYIGRLIKAYTNPGDWILDCFCGSGTVPVVAEALGRNCISCDVSKDCVESARQRLGVGSVRFTRNGDRNGNRCQ